MFAALNLILCFKNILTEALGVSILGCAACSLATESSTAGVRDCWGLSPRAPLNQCEAIEGGHGGDENCGTVQEIFNFYHLFCNL